MDLSAQSPLQSLTISDELVQAYQATDYIVESLQGDAMIRIGQLLDESSPLRLYGKRLAIITAWNPFSETLAEDENQLRQVELVAAVESAKRTWLPARGVDPSGQWPPEPSLAVFDATDDELDAWMDAFGQNAVVVMADGADAALRFHPRVESSVELAPRLGDTSDAAASKRPLIASSDSFEVSLRTALEARIKASLLSVALPFGDELGVVVDVGVTDTGSFFDAQLTVEVSSMAEGLAAIDARIDSAVAQFVSAIDMAETGIRDGYFIDDGGGTYLIAQIVSKVAESLGDSIMPVTGISVAWDHSQGGLEQHDWVDCQEWDDIFLNL